MKDTKFTFEAPPSWSLMAEDVYPHQAVFGPYPRGCSRDPSKKEMMYVREHRMRERGQRLSPTTVASFRHQSESTALLRERGLIRKP
eukprot:5982687-Pyramimonas_sp.AAC.1